MSNLYFSNNIQSELSAGGAKRDFEKPSKCTRPNSILATQSHPRPALVYGDVDGDDLSLRPHSTLARVNLQLESGSQARARHSPFPILGQNGFHGLSLIELCNALKYNDNIMDI